MRSIVTVQLALGNKCSRALFVRALERLYLRVTTKVLLKVCVLRESASANCAHVRLVSLKKHSSYKIIDNLSGMLNLRYGFASDL